MYSSYFLIRDYLPLPHSALTIVMHQLVFIYFYFNIVMQK